MMLNRDDIGIPLAGISVTVGNLELSAQETLLSIKDPRIKD